MLGSDHETARTGAQGSTPAPTTEQKPVPGVILAETWAGQDPTGMIVSEKVDGVRAFWDGSRFVSRQGNVYAAPAWFTAGLPNSPLDGELWAGRGNFQSLVSVVRSGNSPDWETVEYVVFDSPETEGGFVDRIEHLKDNVGSWGNPHVRVLEQKVCGGEHEMLTDLDRVLEAGGEGLMLRAPDSAYTAGRTSNLLKVKKFLDSEARIVGVEPGRGRHAGRVGALVCELGNGTRFKVGTGMSDADRETPPPVGTIITFRYQELTDGGVPRFPVFDRPRPDVDDLPTSLPTVTSEPTPAPLPTPPRPTPPRPTPPPPVVTPTPQPTPTPPTGDRRFPPLKSFVDGSSKFWSVTVDGTAMTTTYGRIGTAGQTTRKEFASETAALNAANKIFVEKQAKGYGHDQI